MLTVGYYAKWPGDPMPGLMNADCDMVVDFRSGNHWMVPGTWAEGS